jgi:transcriptional regulator with XRE-family HTH domain
MDKNTIADRLDSILKLRNISQKELAALAGVKPQIISNIVTGRSYSSDMVEKVAKGLGVKTTYLLGLDEIEETGNMSMELFHDCQAVVLKTCKKEGLIIANTKQLHSLAMELYSYLYNQGLKAMDATRGEDFIQGYLTMQLKMGMIKK